MNSAFLTPLRYPGGKRRLSNFMKLVFAENSLFDGHYVEPYAGGAGLALSLLFSEFASQIHINDLDKSVYCFWRSVLFETEALCNLIESTEVTINEWHNQKAVQENLDSATCLKIGFSTFFLNRTNRSGILKGGVIGGKKQDGPYKLDARFNKTTLSERIRKIARFRSRISLYNLDAADLLNEVVPSLPLKTLVYLDPPYYVKGQGLYRNFYNHEDHEEIAELLNKLKRRWIVTYDHSPEICQMYSKFRQRSYKLSYSAAERYKGSEVMFFSDDLRVPNHPNPSKVPSPTVTQMLMSL